MLQRLSILNLQLFQVVYLFLDNLFFPELDLPFPTRWAIEFFIIFTEVKTAVVQAFVEIFGGDFFTNLLKLGPASYEFCQFLFESGKHDDPGYFWMGASHHDSYNFCSVDV